MTFQMGFQHLHLSFKANRKGTKDIRNPSWQFKEKKRINWSLESQLTSDIKRLTFIGGDFMHYAYYALLILYAQNFFNSLLKYHCHPTHKEVF